MSALVKPVNFDYACARSLDEVRATLAQHGDAARLLAGGQTLVPLLAMRLARPALLLDINRVAELAGIDEDGSSLAIRACTRQADALASGAVRARLPLLAAALACVGHDQTRNRGTVGGSVANADPSAEIPLVAVTLGASVALTSAAGEATLAAQDFFLDAMVTAIEPGQCITAVRFPVWPDAERTGWGFEEVSARASDFALAAAAAQVTFDADGACTRVALGIGGAHPHPVRLHAVEAALAGTRLDDAAVRAACAAVAEQLEPGDDQHASAGYRRRVAVELAARALAAARDRARAAGGMR